MTIKLEEDKKDNEEDKEAEDKDDTWDISVEKGWVIPKKIWRRFRSIKS